jgi:hypothetical protein
MISILVLVAGSRLYGYGQVFLSGHVRDSGNRAPLHGVNISIRSGIIIAATDEAGYFNIAVKKRDLLIFSLLGYRNDTFAVMGVNEPVLIRMIPLHVQLQGVNIRGRRGNYASDSATRNQDFHFALAQQEGRILDFPELKPLESMQNTLQPAGAPELENIEVPIFRLDLDAVYDHLSGKRKRLWKFQKAFYTSEQLEYIHSRVTEELVQRLTDLNGESLTVFIGQYNPAYKFVRQATDYELDADICRNMKSFRQNTNLKQ